MAGAGAAGAGVPAPPGRRAETAAHRRARRQRSDLRHVNWLLKLVAADGMHHTSEAKLTGLIRRWCAPGQGGDSTGGMGAAPPGGASIRESVQAVVLDPYVGAGTPGARAAQRQAAGDSGSPGVGPPAAQAAQRQVHSTMGSSGAGTTSAFAGSCQARLVLQYVDGVVSAQVFQGQAAGEVATPGVGAPAAPAVPLPGAVRPWVGHLGDVGMADAAVGDSMGAEPSADQNGLVQAKAEAAVLGGGERPLRAARFHACLPVQAAECNVLGAQHCAGTIAEKYAFGVAKGASPVVLCDSEVDGRWEEPSAEPAMQVQAAGEVAPGVGTPAAQARLGQAAEEAGVRGLHARIGTVLSEDERLLWAQFLEGFPVQAEECIVLGAAKGAGTVAERYAFEVAGVAFPVQVSFALEQLWGHKQGGGTRLRWLPPMDRRGRVRDVGRH